MTQLAVKGVKVMVHTVCSAAVAGKNLKSDFSKCSVTIDEVVLGLSITEVNKKSCFLLQKFDCELQK